MTVTTERPTDLPADSLASTAGTTVLEEPSSRTALRKRPRGRHRAAAVVRADSVPGEMSHGEILRAMTGLLAALFTAMLSSTIVATALPTIIGDLQGTQRQYTWIITASLLATTVTTPIWGKLADLFSKKLLVQSAIVVFVLGSVAAGMAHNVPFLIACRVVQGLGMGGLTALAAADHGRDRRPPRTRPLLRLHGRGHGRRHRQRPAARRRHRRHPLGWRWTSTSASRSPSISLFILQSQLHLARSGGSPKIDYLGALLIAVTASLPLLWVTFAGNDFAWVSWQSAAFLGARPPSAVALTVVVERRAPNRWYR